MILLFVVIVFTFSPSKAYFTKQIEGGSITLNVGELEYALECNKLTNNQITVPANSSKTFALTLTSKNPIDSKYEIYYKIISPNNGEATAKGGYLKNIGTLPLGIIEQEGSKELELVLQNLESKEVIVEIGIKAGLVYNELILEENEYSFNNETYTVEYNTNGGSGEPSRQTKITGVPLTLSTTVPTKTSHTFLGWSEDKNATTATYAAGATYKKEGNTTLYAVWKANTYTITYNANGGSGAPSGQSYTYASSGTINLSSTIPTRTGYTFLGWSLSPSATSASYSAGQAWKRSNASNYTLYAVWKSNTYTISKASVTGGSIAVASSAVPGATVTFTTTPSSNFTYYGAGIYNSSGTLVSTLSSTQKSFTMPNYAVTIRPKWKRNDLYVLKLDATAVTTWSLAKHEGSTPALLTYNSSRNYIPYGAPSSSSENSRYDMVTDKAFDVTDFQTLTAVGSVYVYPGSNCSPKLYFYTSLVSNRSTWVNGGVSVGSQTSAGVITITSDISSRTGNYYIGLQFLSNYSCGSAEFTSVLLTGKVYQ